MCNEFIEQKFSEVGMFLDNPGVNESLTSPAELPYELKALIVNSILYRVYINIIANGRYATLKKIFTFNKQILAATIADGLIEDEMDELMFDYESYDVRELNNTDPLLEERVSDFIANATYLIVSGADIPSDKVIHKLDIMSSNSIRAHFDIKGESTILLKFSNVPMTGVPDGKKQTHFVGSGFLA